MIRYKLPMAIPHVEPADPTVSIEYDISQVTTEKNDECTNFEW